MSGFFEWRKKRLEKCRRRLFNNYRVLVYFGKDILNSPGFRTSDSFVQHGSVSVRRHSLNVALTALKMSHALPIEVEEKDVVRGALLHDYFLYDWHLVKIRPGNILRFYQMHGFTHPATALCNAQKDFALSLREQDIIRKHMWPLTVKPPVCREAWIVTFADKYCSLLETFRIYT